MTEGTEHKAAWDDDDLAAYQVPFAAEEVPGFFERFLAHTRTLDQSALPEEFSFEGVDGEQTQGCYILPVGAYDSEADEKAEPGSPTALERPADGYAAGIIAFTEAVRRELRRQWGEPLRREVQLVGSEQQPFGLLDIMLQSIGVPDAEMWERGDLACVLITARIGERNDPHQMMLVLPREAAIGGLSALVEEEASEHPLLMHGEHPVELHRRAWLLSAMFGEGEVRLRDTVVEATRCSIRATTGTATVWHFADDGRMLVLLHDPDSEFSTKVPTQFATDSGLIPEPGAGDEAHGNAATGDAATTPELREAREAAIAEAELILIAQMLDDVPDDLRELITARAENMRGDVAEHLLPFRMLGDRPVPVISGVAFFDGEVWRVPVSLTEIGKRNGLGMDDFGFGDAVRGPYRLGGPLTFEHATRPDSPHRERIEQIFAACPYPEQERPDTRSRLGYGVPDGEYAELIEQIEGAARAWWETSPNDMDWGDRTFTVGGSRLRDEDGRAMHAVVANVNPWNADALSEWTRQCIDAMNARWGTAIELIAEDRRTGEDVRAPVTRYMRGTGLRRAPLWWVDGHAVVLLSGTPDPEYGTDPQAIVVIGKADALADPVQGTDWWRLRTRATTIAALVDPGSSPQQLSWQGPPLAGSDIVPAAVRGRLRVADQTWVWHFTHDERGLLLSAPTAGAAPRTFAEQAALFAGVPDDLLSLVIDRDATGHDGSALYDVVTRGDAPSDGTHPLDRARSLPVVDGIFWRDDLDWRASEGLLRRLRPAAWEPRTAAGDTVPTDDPATQLRSPSLGLPQLQWALVTGYSFDAEWLTKEWMGRDVLGRRVPLEEAEAALPDLADVHARALTGSLNDLLDASGAAPSWRYLLDAALSNRVPQHRREIALYLLAHKTDASIELSDRTPVRVLLENPTLDADDAVLLRRLLAKGATPGLGILAAAHGAAALATHPLVVLAHRDLDDAVVVALADALLGSEGSVPVDPLPVDPVPAERAVLEHLEQLELTGFAHGRSREALLERVRAAAE